MRFSVEMLPQPDDLTCGPTCLHAIYRYYGDEQPLETVIREVNQIPGGGTLTAILACHALRRGYKATLYSYNLKVFDPTWFHLGRKDIAERLREQAVFKKKPSIRLATDAYLEFLELGGRLRFEDLTPSLIRRYLNRQVPILTGCSLTYLYRSRREFGEAMREDDVRGEPAGHFVVLRGYDRARKIVHVADPYLMNPIARSNDYEIHIRRILCAILLYSFDANLLILEKQPEAPRKR